MGLDVLVAPYDKSGAEVDPGAVATRHLAERLETSSKASRRASNAHCEEPRPSH